MIFIVICWFHHPIHSTHNRLVTGSSPVGVTKFSLLYQCIKPLFIGWFFYIQWSVSPFCSVAKSFVQYLYFLQAVFYGCYLSRLTNTWFTHSPKYLHFYYLPFVIQITIFSHKKADYTEYSPIITGCFYLFFCWPDNIELPPHSVKLSQIFIFCLPVCLRLIRIRADMTKQRKLGLALLIAIALSGGA